MKKKDIISVIVIGEVCAVIFIVLSKYLGLPEILIKVSAFFPVVLPTLSLLGLWLVSLVSKKIPTLFQMAKSFLVGILNTFIDLGLLNLFMWLANITSGWPYTGFKGLSVSIAIINSYFWNKFWAFEHTEEKAKPMEFGKFYLIALGGLAINVAASSFVVNIVGPQFSINSKIWANIGGIAAALASFLWNFFGYKLFVFKK